jgi:hypothetical protein
VVDFTKEWLAYLRLWLGICIAVVVSLIGWVARNDATEPLLRIVALGIAIALGVATLLIHRTIVHEIAVLTKEE